VTAAEALDPDNTVREWLTHLYGDADGWVSLFALDRLSGERVVRWGRAADVTKLSAEVTKLAPTSCVWFGVATRAQRLPGGKRGERDDCEVIPAMWVDIDVAGPNHARDDLPPNVEAAHELVAMFPLAPTAVVATGGGLQAWWFLAEPVAIDDGEELLVRWGATWADLAARRGERRCQLDQELRSRVRQLAWRPRRSASPRSRFRGVGGVSAGHGQPRARAGPGHRQRCGGAGPAA
jgi:hypothetical protein